MSEVIFYLSIACCLAGVFHAGHQHGKRSQIEAYYKKLLAIEKAIASSVDTQEYTVDDCAGQNCHACANPCEKFTEVEDGDQAKGN